MSFLMDKEVQQYIKKIKKIMWIMVLLYFIADLMFGSKPTCYQKAMVTESKHKRKVKYVTQEAS